MADQSRPSKFKEELSKYDTLITIRGQRTTAYSFLHGNIKAALHDCYPYSQRLIRCPICCGKLVEFFNPITISEDKFIKLDGKVCLNCNAFFTRQEELLEGAVELSPQRSLFKIDDSFTDNLDYAHYHRYMDTLSSAFVQVTVCARNDVRIYTIVGKQQEAYLEENVLHYTNETARTLLTAVLLQETKVELNGKSFTMESVYFVSGNQKSVPVLKASDGVEVRKRKNGGYYTPNPRYELVTGLVFCEKTCRLEMLRVTHDKVTDVYFVDKTVYDIFRTKYGYPIVRYISRKSGQGYVELRDESLLHQLGYSVNSKDNLSDSQRHEILGACVDLMFMDVSSIVNLLKSLIQRNGVQNPQCIPKWQNDLDFIQNYKVNENSERVVFVKRVRGL